MPVQNIQDAFLNNARKDRVPVTIYLTSGVKLSGRVKAFDRYCVIFETHSQEQLIFKHAISTIISTQDPNSVQNSSPEKSTRDFSSESDPPTQEHSLGKEVSTENS